MYLLDTNVISELRKAKAGKADPKVVAWAERVPTPSVFLAVITLLELETGVLLIERRDPAQGAILRRWFWLVMSRWAAVSGERMPMAACGFI